MKLGSLPGEKNFCLTFVKLLQRAGRVGADDQQPQQRERAPSLFWSRPGGVPTPLLVHRRAGTDALQQTRAIVDHYRSPFSFVSRESQQSQVVSRRSLESTASLSGALIKIRYARRYCVSSVHWCTLYARLMGARN